EVRIAGQMGQSMDRPAAYLWALCGYRVTDALNHSSSLRLSTSSWGLMMAIPKRVDERIVKGCQRLRPVLMEARDRDVNEADTVTIVKSVLSDVFGWNPFFEVTSEYAIRSTYVDLAVRTEGQLRYLIEVKAIGGDLKENHLRQAVNYAANQGVDWVVLTNGAIWQAHRVNFGKPISHELVFQLDLINDNVKQARFRDLAFLLSKEGMTKAAIADFHAEKQALASSTWQRSFAVSRCCRLF